MALYRGQKDNVDFKRPEYVDRAEQVRVVADIFNGIDSAKEYLIQAPRESDASYLDRKNNATLKNYVKRAIEAFVGMIFRKQVQPVGFSDDMTNILNKIDKSNTLSRFARDVATELIKGGKVFLAADTSVDGEGDPYALIIPRNRVINWKQDESGAYTMLVVYEAYEQDAGDFGVEIIDQWRVYKADGNIDIYRKNEKGDDFEIYESIETEFDYIPVVALDLDDIPPLYDIAKMTIKHMNRTSFKDKYLDMAAIPVPLIWGANVDEDETGTKPVYIIGVDEAFVFSGTKEESDFQWRELSGNSIDALQRDLDVIENDITSGVINVATSETTTMKTATESYYSSAESSNRVTVIAATIEIGLNKLIKMMADLANLNEDKNARIIVNKDFNPINMGNDSARLLWEIYLGGALSYDTFMKSLDTLELVDIGSPDEEKKRIESDDFERVDKGGEKVTEKNMDNRTKEML